MVNKRLINEMGSAKKYIFVNVFFQWLSLLLNITAISRLTSYIQAVYYGNTGYDGLVRVVAVVAVCMAARYLFTIRASRAGFRSGEKVKQILREKIYKKLLSLGPSYGESVKTAQLVQIAVEGVDQLDTYFSAYLPRLFYAMASPLTLFLVIGWIDISVAVVLLICVPLIPVSIVAVQRWAKKLLSKYWGQYTDMGDTFLENLQGMTTLKIYGADEMKNQEMNRQAEKFRKITMRVLTMQLNSISVMDLVAYGGAATGVILALKSYFAGNITLAGCLMIILLSAEFFIPMRQLGSFFHIAMNGMAAADKIFDFLDVTVSGRGEKGNYPSGADIVFHDVSFSYGDRKILKDINMTFAKNSLTAIVGTSGSGKSTIASLIMGRNKSYSGQITAGGKNFKDIDEGQIFENITYVSHGDYIFKGTIRDNLAMAANELTEKQMFDVLKSVNLMEIVDGEKGLDTPIDERGENLSGGQRQRLALARAILHDSPVYIFDEATSNIDVESENIIMEHIFRLAKEKTVILISHRLANVVGADRIYTLEDGRISQCGTHTSLLNTRGVYSRLFNSQSALENYCL